MVSGYAKHAIVTVGLIFFMAAPLCSADFDAREWGVLDLRDGEVGILGTLPPPSLKEHIVRAPVIYFSTRDQKPFSLTVRFPNGHPVEDFPQAVSTGASLVWNDVVFASVSQAGSATRETPACLRPLAGVLGQVGAAPLLVRGQTTRFLYYEGAVSLTPPLKAEWVGQRLRLTNISDQPIGPISVSTGYAFRFVRVDQGYASLARLDSGKSAVLGLSPSQDAAAFPNLRQMGFPNDEAEAFDVCWRAAVIEPLRQHPWARVFYRLSAPTCERVSSLEFDPPARQVTRALFVIQALPPRPRPIPGN
jgi:hypothetical protein